MNFDTHCHIDLYPNPQAVIKRCSAGRIRTIAVTNAPSVFPATEALVKKAPFVRAAVGLHPELAVERRGELPLMWQAMKRTRYVGEIGLDYASGTRSQHAIQRRVFESILAQCSEMGGKVLTVHSRRAADDVVSAISKDLAPGVILHWYSGSLSVMRKAVEMGAYFSVNPAMARRSRFQRFLSEIPQSRLLLESDGPFVQVGGRAATPSDLGIVTEAIAMHWRVSTEEAEAVLFENFRSLLAHAQTSIQSGPEVRQR